MKDDHTHDEFKQKKTNKTLYIYMYICLSRMNGEVTAKRKAREEMTTHTREMVLQREKMAEDKRLLQGASFQTKGKFISLSLYLYIFLRIPIVYNI